MSKIISIDLGTTNSVVAVLEGGAPSVITNAQGSRTTPSVVAFTESNDRLVGQMAKRQSITNPANTVYSIKRFMGRRHSEVTKEEKLVPYTIIGNNNELVKVKINDKTYTPPEISAMILGYLKEQAEAYLGEAVTEAVITVPAYFNDSQRQATKDAGTIAGLDVKRIINEPTAAALAYGLDKKKRGTVAVFDFGGGTFDVSILEISEVDGESLFEVIATNGDGHLGGDDVDEALINYVADEFTKEHGVDLRADQMALQRLKVECEKAKCELSSTTTTQINLPFITIDADRNPVHLNVALSRAKLEQIAEAIFERLVTPCRVALEDAKLSAKQIDEVILVGGSTRIPKVVEIAQEIFGRAPHKGVNPDEVVGIGAAIQAGVLQGDVKDILLIDVTPLSLGVEVEGALMHSLIEKNTAIPKQAKEVFSTAADSQPAVDIFVYQGERPMAKDNRLLGHFKLDGIPPAPRGHPQVEVTFDIDANGILNVTAKDLGTGKEQQIRIESSSGLSKDEISKMQSEAEEHASEDLEKRKEVEILNESEKLIYTTQKMIDEYGSKLDSEIEKAVDNLKKAVKNKNIPEIQAAKTELEQCNKNAAKELYKAATTANSEKTNETIDADYTVKS